MYRAIDIGGSQVGEVLPSGVMWKCLEEFLVVPTWGLLLTSVVRDQGCGQTPRKAQDRSATGNRLVPHGGSPKIDRCAYTHASTNPVLYGWSLSVFPVV